MLRPEVERSVLAVLVVPLAGVSLACGMLTVQALDAAHGPRRAAALAAAVPKLIEAEQALQAERSATVSALAADQAARRRLPSSRNQTDVAVARLAKALEPLRGDPGSSSPAARSASYLGTSLKALRRTYDHGDASAQSARSGYSAAVATLVAVPAAVADAVADAGLAQTVRRLGWTLEAADAVAATVQAGDRLWADGDVAVRTDLDEFAGQVAVLNRAVDRFGPDPRLDPKLTADLGKLVAGVGERSSGTPFVLRRDWDAAAARAESALLRSVGADGADAASVAHAQLRRDDLRALASVLAALVVITTALVHGRRVARRCLPRVLPEPAVPGPGPLPAGLPTPRTPQSGRRARGVDAFVSVTSRADPG